MSCAGSTAKLLEEIRGTEAARLRVSSVTGWSASGVIHTTQYAGYLMEAKGAPLP
jgi:hypothetical protein